MIAFQCFTLASSDNGCHMTNQTLPVPQAKIRTTSKQALVLIMAMYKKIVAKGKQPQAGLSSKTIAVCVCG